MCLFVCQKQFLLLASAFLTCLYKEVEVLLRSGECQLLLHFFTLNKKSLLLSLPKRPLYARATTQLFSDFTRSWVWIVHTTHYVKNLIHIHQILGLRMIWDTNWRADVQRRISLLDGVHNCKMEHLQQSLNRFSRYIIKYVFVKGLLHFIKWELQQHFLFIFHIMIITLYSTCNKDRERRERVGKKREMNFFYSSKQYDEWFHNP